MIGFPGMSKEERHAYLEESVERLIAEGVICRIGDGLVVTDYGRCVAEEWERRGLLTKAGHTIKTKWMEFLYVMIVKKP